MLIKYQSLYKAYTSLLTALGDLHMPMALETKQICKYCVEDWPCAENKILLDALLELDTIHE